MTDESRTAADTYGVALELEEIDTKAHALRGRVYIDTPPLVRRGDEITVTFGRGDAHWRMIEGSLKKGQAAPPKGVAAKSLLVLENVYRDESGQIIARWVRTARSALKTLDESTRHDHRDVQRAWVSEPVLTFKNPNTNPQDPDYIEWPVTATCLNARGRDNEERVYDLPWLAARLQEARRVPDIPVSVRLLSFTPKSPLAQADMDRAAALQGVTDLVGRGQQALVLFRESGRTITHRIWSAEDVSYLRNRLPSAGLRVVPAATLFFGTDSANALIDGIAEGKCPLGIRFLFIPPGQAATMAAPRTAGLNERTLLAPVLLTVSDWNGEATDATEKPQGALRQQLYIQTPDLVKLLPNAGRTLGDMIFKVAPVAAQKSAASAAARKMASTPAAGV